VIIYVDKMDDLEQSGVERPSSPAWSKSKSRRSVHSKASIFRRNLTAIELQRDEDLNRLTTNVSNIKREIIGLEIQMKTFTRVIDKMTDALELCSEDEDRTMEVKAELEKVEDQLFEIQNLLTLKNADLELAEAHCHRESDMIRTRAAVDKLILEQKFSEEEELDLELDEQELQSKKKTVEEWASQTEVERVRREAQDEFQQSPEESNKTEKETPAEVKVETGSSTPLAGSIGELVQALTQAFGQLGSSRTNTDRHDKFLARQSHSKDLPFFGGRPEEWPQFICDFKRTTETCSFTDAENMSRLRKCLKGEAAKAVQCLMISPDNLNIVIQTLETRFGQPRHIVKAMIEKARKAPQVREDKAETLIEFGTAVVNMTSTIKALKCNEHLSNPSLIEELESRLPFNYRMAWADWKSAANKTGDLENFTIWLQTRIKIACEVCPPKLFEDQMQSSSTANRRGNYDRRQQIRKNDSVNVLESSNKEPAKKRERKCFGCDETGHWIQNCSKFNALNVDDRWKRTREVKLCLSCLIPGHQAKDCRRKKKCGKDGCQRHHHPLLHGDNNVQQVTETPVETVEEVNLMDNNYNSDTIMQIIPVRVSGPKGEVKAYAFVDNGSSLSLVTSQLADQLGLEGESTPLCIKTLNSFISQPNSRKVKFSISGDFNGAKDFVIEEVRTVDCLNLRNVSQNRQQLVKQWPYLKNVPIKTYSNVNPSILIGMPDTYLITPQQYVGTSSKSPMAWKSKLGWSVGGPQRNGLGRVDVECSYHMCEASQITDESLHQMIKNSFTVEDFGVKIVSHASRSKEDLMAMKILEETTKRVQGSNRFETSLLWKSDSIILPESKSVAMSRLRCQERKMDRDAHFAEKYVEKMNEYLQKDFIRKLDKEELDLKNPKIWYLPHFGNINPNKPDKIRLVFDAAAMSNGTSLNNNLMQGPDLANPLVAVLWKFRQYEVAFCGDVKDMFHRVYIREEDRPALRFLWRGLDRISDPDVYEMKVMIFGAVCSPSCAQFVKNLNADEHKSTYPEACAAIKTKMYVDDYPDSTPTEEEAIQLIKDVITVQREGGFVMCSWISNSRIVMESIPPELRAKYLKDLNFENSDIPIERVLGLWWNPEEDHLTFKLRFHKIRPDILSGNQVPTKREVLKLVMSVYDPLGFLCHLIIKARILQQEIWRSGLSWDEELNAELFQKWRSWLEELQGITDVKIPRCYSLQIPRASDIQLHVFCDASEKAFAAVAFLRVKGAGGIDVSFVSSKARVAPLKDITIVKLEMQAAVMGCRLAKSIKSELEIVINATYYWTDSYLVLRYLRATTRRFKQFYANRIGEISESTDLSEWHWVPTKLNVADDATRDTAPSDLTMESRWFNGEEFLKKDERFWPKETMTDSQGYEGLELKAEVLNIMSEVLQIPDPLRFSSWTRLTRATAWMMRFIHNSKHKTQSTERLRGPLRIGELRNAERYWWKLIQAQRFSEELEYLHGGKKVLKKSPLWKLDPFVDSDGILRVGGRIHNANRIAEYARHPIFLDSSHRFTKLLVEDYHRIYGHQGKKTVANELRQKYWILGVTGAVKRAWRDCKVCQLRRIQPVVPEMGNLPEVRLSSRVRPFTNTGLDFFGPMIVTIGRRKEKRWGALFTCLSTRAIHLELASSLSADSAIMAIRRMSNRRGTPMKIYSDNGTNFVGANHELQRAVKELNWSTVDEKLTTLGIEWKFIPPSSPHMGGSWERLVGSVKTVLREILKTREPKEEILMTLFTEVEMIVNSRPLTDVSVDPKDLESLTPNHFLIGWSGGVGSRPESSDAGFPNNPIGKFDDDDLWLRKQWRTVQRLGDHFWTRWVKEYLPSLTKREKWNKIAKPIKVGDIVIVVDDQGPRNQWPKGKVVAVFPGKDGKIRVADVKLEHGTFRRPVAKLCVLDVTSDLNEADNSCSLGGRMS